MSCGALLTGQSLRTALQTGFSMAQIGEFSFIIASLGLAYGVISKNLYPIIVAASLMTTFTTPYLMKISERVILELEKRLPPILRETMDSYAAWIQRRTLLTKGERELSVDLLSGG